MCILMQLCYQFHHSWLSKLLIETLGGTATSVRYCVFCDFSLELRLPAHNTSGRLQDDGIRVQIRTGHTLVEICLKIFLFRTFCSIFLKPIWVVVWGKVYTFQDQIKKNCIDYMFSCYSDAPYKLLKSWNQPEGRGPYHEETEGVNW